LKLNIGEGRLVVRSTRGRKGGKKGKAGHVKVEESESPSFPPSFQFETGTLKNMGTEKHEAERKKRLGNISGG